MSSTANLSNWRESPHSAWAFHNVDKIISTREIKKSTSPKALEKNESASIASLQIPLAEGKSLGLASLLENTNTDGFVVLHQGKLVYDYYAHGNDVSSKHIFMSITKSMTGLIVGSLVEKGVLSVDDKVVKHLPELASTAFAPATIRDLLDMRSGIKYPDSSHEYRMACGWNAPQPGEKQLDIPTFLSNLNPPDTETPPAGFFYASVSTDAIGLLLERVTGKTFAELAHEYLWQPAGAEYDALITVDTSGNPRAAGGMAASILDLARIGQALIDGKLVSKQWLDDMLHDGDLEGFAASTWGPAFKPFSPTLKYRSFWLSSGPENMLIALGIHGQMMVVDFEKQIVLAKTSSQANFFDVQASGLALRFFRTLQHVLK